MKTELIKGSFYFIILFLLFFFNPQKTFAGDVVLNEFFVDASTQWVELYNKGQVAIDISGWFIDDNGGTQKYTIPGDTLINPSEFKTFDSGLFNFNKTTPDEARLIKNTNIEDSYSYSTGPGTGKSYGRSIDGAGIWVIFETPTKGSTNNSSASSPVPTATPTPTPTPSQGASSTATPTPASVAASEPQENIAEENSSDTTKISPIATSLSFDLGKVSTKESVLGSESAQAPVESVNPEVKTLGKSENVLQKAFIIIGILSIITSLVIFGRQWIKRYLQKA